MLKTMPASERGKVTLLVSQTETKTLIPNPPLRRLHRRHRREDQEYTMKATATTEPPTRPQHAPQQPPPSCSKPPQKHVPTVGHPIRKTPFPLYLPLPSIDLPISTPTPPPISTSIFTTPTPTSGPTSPPCLDCTSPRACSSPYLVRPVGLPHPMEIWGEERGIGIWRRGCCDRHRDRAWEL